MNGHSGLPTPISFLSAANRMKPKHFNGEAPKAASDAKPTKDVDEALRFMRSRTPQESLGLKNDNYLTWAFLVSTAGAVVVIGLLTAVPYFWEKMYPSTPVAQKPATADGPESGPAPAEATSMPATETNAKNPSGKADTAKSPKKKDLLDALGESGVKTAKPSVNPLDKKDDDLLKELK